MYSIAIIVVMILLSNYYIGIGNMNLLVVKYIYNCKQTIQYFSDFQSTFQSYPLGMLSGCICGLVMMTIITGTLLVNSDIRFREMDSYIIIYIFPYGVFVSSYKVANCMLGRMCENISCS
jgi:tellurite resistance protein TehA-like permease